MTRRDALHQRLSFIKSGAVEPANVIRYIVGASEYIDGNIEHFEDVGLFALDTHTLEMRLVDADFYLIENLRTDILVPVHPSWSVVSENDHQAPFLTSGAYRPVEYLPKQYLKLVKNEHYHDADSVSIGVVEYYTPEYYQNQESIYKDTLNGKIGIVQLPNVELLEWFEKNHPSFVAATNYQSFTYLDFNFKNSELAKYNIRKALSLAVDKKAVSSILDAQKSVSMDRWFIKYINGLPPSLYTPVENTYESNIETARKILLEEGYTKDKPLKLTLRTQSTKAKLPMARALKGMWQQIGVEVDHIVHTSSREFYIDYLVPGKFDIALAGWASPTPDLSYFIDFVHSKESVSGKFNYGSYMNANVDRALEAAHSATSLFEQNQQFMLAEKHLLEDYGKVPLSINWSSYIIHPSVNGQGSGLFGYIPSKYLSIE